MVGDKVGVAVVGESVVGETVGAFVVGERVGERVVGLLVGDLVVGDRVVGDRVGELVVGDRVGAAVSPQPQRARFRQSSSSCFLWVGIRTRTELVCLSGAALVQICRKPQTLVAQNPVRQYADDDAYQWLESRS